ncbi:hypothetical protein FJ546_22250 [Mesorhizobium sp. B2-4-19]|uniref:hypothetical protein n=1 Tax=Mesorhizobium sp. B2-4-19 TaxID=2589930 RepID=UPI00112827BC|nr:hypothetical protein [Mesorhizobium sp. B2-4-19]TPK59211.1 hypothetical protein FJ546_22250 [Mesorhizobium sp. B2-4-19]
MNLLGEKLLGKELKAVVKSGDTCEIQFSDGSAFTVYTAICCRIDSEPITLKVVSVQNKEDKITITFNENSFIDILLDEKLISSPEIFVYHDSDGQIIVETVK